MNSSLLMILFSTGLSLVTPLILRDLVIGVLSMQSYHPNAYSLDQIRLLEA